MTDGREAIRTPSLEHVIDLALAHHSSMLRVAMPGKVEEYNAEEQKADIQPLLKDGWIDDDGADAAESLPIVTDVPVVFPRAGSFYITLPVAKGDHVLLVVCDRSIDKFATGSGEETDPVDLRKHDLSDAVALVGFYPFEKAIGDEVGSHAIVGHEGGSVIALKDDDEIHLGSIDAADWVALATSTKDEIQAVADALDTFISTYNTHTHPYVDTPAGPSVTSPTLSTGTPPGPVGDVKAEKVKAD